MTKEQMLALSGRELFHRQAQALRQKRITLQQLRLTSELWLRHQGYVLTAAGWRQVREGRQAPEDASATSELLAQARLLFERDRSLEERR